MKAFEISLQIIDEKYCDSLILGLTHQGYNVYYNSIEHILHFTTGENEVFEISSIDNLKDEEDLH